MVDVYAAAIRNNYLTLYILVRFDRSVIDAITKQIKFNKPSCISPDCNALSQNTLISCNKRIELRNEMEKIKILKSDKLVLEASDLSEQLLSSEIPEFDEPGGDS